MNWFDWSFWEDVGMLELAFAKSVFPGKCFSLYRLSAL